jgi:hypothetical protein
MTGYKQSQWVSAHVYLGVALVIIVSLHCGFQFGWNVHTLAYVLMIMVVASGGFGLYAYLVFPAAITRLRNGESRRAIITNISSLDENCLSLASEMGEQIYHAVLTIVEGTAIGGSAWQQLSGKAAVISFSEEGSAGSMRENSIPKLFTAKTIRVRDSLKFSEDILQKYVVEAENTEQIGQAGDLLGLMTRRHDLVQRLRGDVRYHALMKAWLYLHVPLSIALLAALVIHVIVVFFYW